MNKLVIFCVLISVFSPVVSMAHDVYPPDWRGFDGTTYQEWRFDNATTPAVPEVINNDYGIASASITVGGMG